MVFFLNNPQATADALSILRSGENFNLYVIFMIVAVLYIYFSEGKKKNWAGIAAGLSLYMIHWFVEVINAIIQHVSGHALWTVPAGTAYLIFVGVGIELSLMFSIAGLAVSKLLPEDPKELMFSIGRFGVPKPLAIGIGNAALASIIEIFLIYTQSFVWVWEWWNAFTVFIFVYIPFFVVACYAYYWKPKKQRNVIGVMALVNVVLILIFGLLGWI
ncbi:MAG: hypothetical protein EU516_00635 [Promethearchaeota archaeon]|nr:MAG: hypothetical protein EU516_00635 [Candidatus Lokiarchaeota archaeon]